MVLRGESLNAVRRFVLVFTLLLLSSFCFAEMSIYLKNGGEYRVRKIVFNGSQAELFLPDGKVVQVPVSDIDLDGSGIGSASGTYGETTLGGKSGTPLRPTPMVNEPLRQSQLREEWESSEKSAIALRDVDRFHAGEVVRITERRLSPDKAPPPMDYYWQSKPPPEQVQDQAYIILYRNPDGTFGKKMVDAGTFATNFKIQTKTLVMPPPAPVPVPPQATQTETAPALQADNTKPDVQETAVPSPGVSSPTADSSNLILIGVIALVVIGVGAAIFVTAKGRKKAFVDTSKFRTYEEELRDFEIEIWLKNGKTMDQLVDICAKKFYQDNPAALAVVSKILKGTPKSGVIQHLMKQAETDQLQAELIYDDLERRIDWIRAMIQTVSNRTGLTAIVPKEAPKPVVAPPQLSKTIPGGGPPPLPPAANPPQPAPPPVPTAALKPPEPAWEALGRMVSEKEETPLPPTLPPYFHNIYKQLGTLG